MPEPDTRTHGEKTRDGMDARSDDEVPVRQPTVPERMSLGWIMLGLSGDDVVFEWEADFNASA